MNAEAPMPMLELFPRAHPPTLKRFPNVVGLLAVLVYFAIVAMFIELMAHTPV